MKVEFGPKIEPIILNKTDQPHLHNIPMCGHSNITLTLNLLYIVITR